MNKNRLKVSYLSNVLFLSKGGAEGGAWTIADNLAVFCSKRDEEGKWVIGEPVAVELLDGAETLLPHLLPEEFEDKWPATKWQPKVDYDRDRDILRLFNDETCVMSRSIAENLIIGYNEDGHPASVEILDAAELLLPYLLPLAADIQERMNSPA